MHSRLVGYKMLWLPAVILALSFSFKFRIFLLTSSILLRLQTTLNLCRTFTLGSGLGGGNLQLPVKLFVSDIYQPTIVTVLCKRANDFDCFVEEVAVGFNKTVAVLKRVAAVTQSSII